jgi:hypothetical protein
MGPCFPWGGRANAFKLKMLKLKERIMGESKHAAAGRLEKSAGCKNSLDGGKRIALVAGCQFQYSTELIKTLGCLHDYSTERKY